MKLSCPSPKLPQLQRQLVRVGGAAWRLVEVVGDELEERLLVIAEVARKPLEDLGHDHGLGALRPPLVGALPKSTGHAAWRGPICPMTFTSIRAFVRRIASPSATSSPKVEPIDIPAFNTNRSKEAAVWR